MENQVLVSDPTTNVGEMYLNREEWAHRNGSINGDARSTGRVIVELINQTIEHVVKQGLSC